LYVPVSMATSMESILKKMLRRGGDTAQGTQGPRSEMSVRPMDFSSFGAAVFIVSKTSIPPPLDSLDRSSPRRRPACVFIFYNSDDFATWHIGALVSDQTLHLFGLFVSVHLEPLSRQNRHPLITGSKSTPQDP
jgi:hypothetical protein